MKELKPQLDRFKQNITTTTIDGDPGETGRRTVLTRYAHQLLAPPPILVNGLRSAMEEIEKQSEALLAKGVTARFVDKAGDSGEVVRLIERLREAVMHYQVSGNWFVASSAIHIGGQISQQQAIYDRIINLTVRIYRSASVLHADDWLFN